MNEYNKRPHLQFPIKRLGVSITLKVLAAVLALNLFATVAVMGAEQPDALYLQVYRLMEKADTLSAQNKLDAAKARYLQAKTNLAAIKENFPTWNTKLVAFRLDYLNSKIEEISKPVAPAKTAAKPAGEAASAEAGVVKLIEAGAEPRQVLRFAPQAGDKQSVVLTAKSSMDMGTGQAMNMPAMKTPMDVAVTSVADGKISYEATLGEMTIEEDSAAAPELAQAMKSMLGGMSGQVIAATISDRGTTASPPADAANKTNPQAQQMVEQTKDALSAFIAHFPEEAVGLGAKWEITQTLKLQGMTVNQTSAYELVSIQDGVVELKTGITQNAANQKMENPAMPGMKFDLTKMTSSGNGTRTLQLTHLLPSAGSTQLQTDMAMGMSMGSKKQNMNVKTETSFQIQSQ